MIVWPLYHFDDPVECFHCRTKLDLAKAGDVVGFGDGHGNREQTCHACGLITAYDCSKSRAAVTGHWEQNADLFEQRRERCNAIREGREIKETRTASGAARPSKVSRNASGNRPPHSAFALPTDEVLERADRKGGAFDLLFSN